jgi:hypothetical protein
VSDQLPPFAAYRLPLERRRHGPAAALSLLVHVAVAMLVLWRGAALLAGGGGSGPRGGGEGGGRPTVRWFTLASSSTPQMHEVPAAPVVTVPDVVLPDPVRIEVPQLQPAAPSVTAAATVGTGAGTSGGPGEGGGRGTGAGVDSGPGSGGAGSYIFPASPRWMITPPLGGPAAVRGRRYEVRFWVTAEGRVTRVDVNPPIKDAAYRREFIERMKGFLFIPARTRDGTQVESIFSITVTP